MTNISKTLRYASSFRHFCALVGCIVLFLSVAPVCAAAKHAAYSGGEILFIGPSASHKRDLFSVRPDGSGLRKLTRQGIGCIGASWSPDKKSVVMSIATKIGSGKTSTYRYNLAILNVRNGAIRNVAIVGYPQVKPFNPAFSPSGQQIVFVGSSRKNFFVLYRINLDGTHLWHFTGYGGERSGHLSHDGRKITFSYISRGKENIYTTNVDGKNEHQITYKNGADYSPNFSPNEKKIAFVSSRHNQSFQIFTMNVDGTGEKQLTYGKEKNYSPTFSLDGRQIAFARYLGVGKGSQIFVMNADGTNQHRITFGMTYATFPDWR